MDRVPRTDGLMTDLAKGAVAGAVATWVMGQATTYMYEHEDESAREREDEAREGTTAYVAAAEKGANLLGRELSEERAARVGFWIRSPDRVFRGCRGPGGTPRTSDRHPSRSARCATPPLRRGGGTPLDRTCASTPS
jgi:hypothetical protein